MMKEYEDHGIKFIYNHNEPYPIAKEWELHLPTKYEYPIKGMILRCFDELLRRFEEAESLIPTNEGRIKRTRRRVASRPLLFSEMTNIVKYI